MKKLNEFLNESVNEEDFSDAMDSYLSDNYSDETVKTILNYKGDEFKKSSYSGTVLYRGIFFNGLAQNKIADLDKLAKTYKMQDIESWTTSYEEAKFFGVGKTKYDNVGSLESESKNLDDDQAGVIISMKNIKSKDVIFDADYALSNGADFDVIEGDEVLLRKHKPKIEILSIISKNSVTK